MIKKVFLIICCLFFLTGCSATYNLKISSDGFEENVEVIDDNGSNLDDYYIPINFKNFDLENPNIDLTAENEGVKYYNKSVNNDVEYKIINYKHKFDDINDSTFFNLSFDGIKKHKYDYDGDGVDDYTIIAGTDKFNLFDKYEDLDSVTINITCMYKVISNNADEVNGNTYTWYINRDNIRPFSLVYDDSKEKFSIIDFIDKYSFIVLIIVVIPLAFFIFNVIKSRSSHVNKI